MTIMDKLALAEGYIEALKKLRIKVRGASDLADDFILRGAVERYMHLAIEAIIDARVKQA